ncbi:MAG: hypothetical protein ABJA67_14820, partial [Chthonomonadales bacterium]
IAQAATMVQKWRERPAADRNQFLKNIVERVVIHPDHVEIRLHVPALVNQILGGGDLTFGFPQIASIECPFRHVRQGHAVRIVVAGTSITTDASRQAILKAIARARRWYEQITTGEASSIAQLAEMHRVSPRFIHMHMKLVQLGPQSIESMITRRQSLPLSLNDLLTAIPMHWKEQTFAFPARSA